MNRLLIGKKALVTGGGTGVGRGIARRLLQHGAHVTLAARRMEVLEATAQQLRSEIDAATLEIAQCDVTQEEEVAAAVARAAGDDGRLDIAVANAGSGAPGPILLLGA
ncbi:MAG: SDR family NAD(P)-dependent oxidoreductase, partial [Deltaproteobacteria bacterium]|nr:SDR family NAD(P)-dependent oxidoreductase [Deltaproteobacteria bacterium]